MPSFGGHTAGPSGPCPAQASGLSWTPSFQAGTPGLSEPWDSSPLRGLEAGLRPAGQGLRPWPQLASGQLAP
eukprot:NODE_24443_length_230_cov_2.453039_g23273_i0.p3 GENE.NODE_24443_length_230_cov_2.453039_g23273_i0~~NODE_24443_length_230_cov_2.453039_g23273_i0.p3  ORF type:complete len:72 (-),score=4.59 NODE_24443_length_230_cov_2.453039_g23273_i0:6-221(-)